MWVARSGKERSGSYPNGKYAMDLHPSASRSGMTDRRGVNTLSYRGNVRRNQLACIFGFQGSSVEKCRQVNPSSFRRRSVGEVTGLNPVVIITPPSLVSHAVPAMTLLWKEFSLGGRRSSACHHNLLSHRGPDSAFAESICTTLRPAILAPRVKLAPMCEPPVLPIMIKFW